MRISNNFAVLGYNTGYTNSYSVNNNAKSYIDYTSTDSVSFGHRGAKKLQNAVTEKVTRRGLRHIKNCLHGEFNEETKQAVDNIHKNITALNEYIEKTFKTKPGRLSHLRESSGLLVTENSRGLKFKIGEGKSLQVIRHRTKQNLLRLTLEENGNTFHYMLDGTDKAIANIWQKEPGFLPKTFRYMTTEEIEKSGIKTYIDFANESVEKFKSYIMNAPTNRAETFAAKKAAKANTAPVTKVQTKVSQSPAPPVVKHVTKLAKENSTPKNDFLALFDSQNPAELPKHVKPIISEQNGLLGFSTKLENGSELGVLKTMSSTYGKDLRYIQIIEKVPTGGKKYINIDLETGDILKTSSIDGKPLVHDNVLLSYTPGELKRSPIESRLAEYAKQIFRTVEGAEAAPAEVLPNKVVSKKARTEIDLADIEDANIRKLVEKEFAETQTAPKVLNPDKPTEPKPEAVQVPKKRGRKPKIKTQEEQPTVTTQKTVKEEPKSTVKEAQTVSNDTVAKLARLKAEATKQATDDAKVFAETYFQTFIEQFQTNIKSKMGDFMEKFGDLMKTFGKLGE